MLDDIFKDDTVDILPHLGLLTAAYLLAFPIGWDREREERSAGLRTFPLVAVASCGFIEATETVLNYRRFIATKESPPRTNRAG